MYDDTVKQVNRNFNLYCKEHNILKMIYVSEKAFKFYLFEEVQRSFKQDKSLFINIEFSGMLKVFLYCSC